MKISVWKFVFAVIASLLAGIIILMLESEKTSVYEFQEWLGDQHQNESDRDLMEFVLLHEREVVQIRLNLGPELADKIEDQANSSDILIPLDSIKPFPMQMDLIVRRNNGDDFFFSRSGSGNIVIKGTFRVVGCAQVGTGWFTCELLALNAESHLTNLRSADNGLRLLVPE